MGARWLLPPRPWWRTGRRHWGLVLEETMAILYGDDWPDLIDGTNARDLIYGFGDDDDI